VRAARVPHQIGVEGRQQANERRPRRAQLCCSQGEQIPALDDFAGDPLETEAAVAQR
jgi:hypothetical protein